MFSNFSIISKRIQIVFLLAFLTLFNTSCNPQIHQTLEQESTSSTTQGDVLTTASWTASPSETIFKPSPVLLSSQTATTTPKPSQTATNTQEPLPIIASAKPITATKQPFDIDLRASFVTYEYNSQGVETKSQLWVLYPPYDSPQLLYETENGNKDLIITPPFWSNDNYRVLLFN